MTEAAKRIRLHAENRLTQALAEIRRSQRGDFPYPDPKHALSLLHELFDSRLTEVKRVDLTADELQICGQKSLESLNKIYRHLGLLSRCTAVANPFELHSPLLRITSTLLGKSPDEVRLILSTEWNYSPFTFSHDEDLDSYFFIGLPATESANPLIAALAGHELGHIVWRGFKFCEKFFFKDIEDEVVELLHSQLKRLARINPSFKRLAKHPELNRTRNEAYPVWNTAWTWAGAQVEELFCDCLGTRVFGESYLHAFAYWLTPRVPGQRASTYPSLAVRIKCIEHAARSFGINPPRHFRQLFDSTDSVQESSELQGFQLKLADKAAEAMIPSLAKLADQHCQRQGMARLPSRAEISAIAEEFRACVPTERAKSLAAILSAGWQAYNDDDFWSWPTAPSNKVEQIAELVLKSAELLEIHTLQHPKLDDPHRKGGKLPT